MLFNQNNWLQLHVIDQANTSICCKYKYMLQIQVYAANISYKKVFQKRFFTRETLASIWIPRLAKIPTHYRDWPRSLM